MDAAARVVDAVAEATGTAGDRAAVVDRIVGYYAAALQVADEIDDPSQTAALLVWTLLAPLGTLPDGAMVGPTSRAWYEELRLAPVVADALRSRGLDEGAAWWAAERVRTLLDLPLPSMLGGPARTPAAPAGRRLAVAPGRPAVHPGQRLGRRRVVPPRVVGRAAGVGGAPGVDPGARGARPARPVERSALEATLTDAADASGYRVDRLREALGARPAILAEPESEAGEEPEPSRAAESGPEPEPLAGPAPATTAKVKRPAKPKKSSKAGKGKNPRKSK